MSSQLPGVLFAVLVIGIACVVATRNLVSAAPNRVFVGLGFLLGAGGFALAMGSALIALAPGTPAAHGALAKPGDALALPAAAHGPIRLLVHGRLAGNDPSTAHVKLDLGAEHLSAKLSRTQSRARLGRRGSTTVIHEHSSEYLETNAAQTAERITLARIDGALSGPVEVAVFTNPLPLQREILLALLLLLLPTAFVTARSGARSAGLTALSTALLFGMLVHRMATPDAAVGPEFGALLLSAFAGVIVSTLLLAVMQKAV